MCIFVPGTRECWILHLLILVTAQGVAMNSALASEFSPPLKVWGSLNAPCSDPYFLPSALTTKLLIIVHPVLVCIFN